MGEIATSAHIDAADLITKARRLVDAVWLGLPQACADPADRDALQATLDAAVDVLKLANEALLPLGARA